MTRNGKAKSERAKVLQTWKTYVTEDLHPDLEAVLAKLNSSDLPKFGNILTSVYQYEGRLKEANFKHQVEEGKRRQARKALIDSIVAFVKERQEKDDHPRWATVAKKFRIKIAEIEDLIVESDGRLEDIAGIRAGGGISAFEKQGDHQIEYTGE